MWWLDFGGAAKVDTNKIACPVYLVSCASDGLIRRRW